MPIVCPTITAESIADYRRQMEKVAHFAHRIQIDLTDGKFAPSQTVTAAEAWWPVGVAADFHIMHQNPVPAVREILKHKPNLIIVHAEADGSFEEFADHCRQAGVKVGVALLSGTPPRAIESALELIDHVLIFSGNLGYQGGSRADMSLLSKIEHLKKFKPNLEIGWDGGVNDQNIAQLIFGGVDVINVGGFIQSADNPERAYRTLSRIADETGTT
jgi:ribulose-phosphate 3-epimerase